VIVGDVSKSSRLAWSRLMRRRIFAVSDEKLEIRRFDAEWGNPRSYSQAVSAGHFIFTCGQIGADPNGKPLPFAEEVQIALQRLVGAVEAAGGSVETILKINGYLADLKDFPVYDETYRRIIGVSPKPARTTVQIAAFPPPIRVEIDAIAVVRDRVASFGLK
jgi:2-iminobutanoate/2-iminopropanoate deaminase